ncbi:CDC42 small effector protein [Pimephales promelas]|nr:CDC42 small effector protein [Pimephales promelas]
MSEFWLCFNCCIAEQPQPKRRRRIDRSMIGEPTNFVHTAHVGSGDIFSGMNSVNSIQNQMQSKGGIMRVAGRGSVMSDSCSYFSPCVLDGHSSPHYPANTGTVVKRDATRLISDARMPTSASPASICALL